MLLFCFLLFLSIAHHVNCVVSLFSSIDCIYSYIQLLAASVFNKFSVSVSVRLRSVCFGGRCILVHSAAYC